MGDVIELDQHVTMTPDQTLARAQREGLDNVIIVGSKKGKGLFLVTSDLSTMEAYWALSKATQAIFNG